jgi:putative FmdB family regulatory protein
MPIYVYACTNCGERTEAKQSFDDPPLEVCPHCGGKLRKMYSPVGIVFKGSGFYSTDAKRSSSSTKSSGSDSGSEKGSGSDKTSGSDKGSGGSGETKRSDSSSSTKSSEGKSA